MSMSTSKKIFTSLQVILLLVLIAATIFVFTNAQKIADWITLYNYTPPQRIAEIRDNIDLTDEGETLFYVNNPLMVGDDEFTSVCPVREKTIVYGCHRTGEIYIFDVSDELQQLQGVEEVTAAHEMLHAAYDRLNETEKQRINALLQEVYDSLPADSEIKKTIDDYRSQGESIIPNEMHSILGTEMVTLPAELEDYYARYFEDRSRVTTYSEKYADVFRQLEARIESYDADLQRRSVEITSTENEISTYKTQLESLSAQLDGLKQNPREYNKIVDSYNGVVEIYNGIVQRYKNQIAEYNDIVNLRNEISAQQTSLYDAIDANSANKE